MAWTGPRERSTWANVVPASGRVRGARSGWDLEPHPARGDRFTESSSSNTTFFPFARRLGLRLECAQTRSGVIGSSVTHADRVVTARRSLVAGLLAISPMPSHRRGRRLKVLDEDRVDLGMLSTPARGTSRAPATVPTSDSRGSSSRARRARGPSARRPRSGPRRAGLIARPTSKHAYASTDLAVSSSTSTSHAQAAYEIVEWGGGRPPLSRVDDRRVRLQLRSGAGDELAVAPGRGRGHVLTPIFSAARPSRSPRRRRSRGRPVDLHSLPRSRGSSPPGGRLLTAFPATNVARDANVPVQTGDESVFDCRTCPVVGNADRLGDDLRLDRLRAVADVGRAAKTSMRPSGFTLIQRLRRVAVLVHAGGVLDRRDPVALVCFAISAPPWSRPERRGARGAAPLRAGRWSSSGSRPAARGRSHRRSP